MNKHAVKMVKVQSSLGFYNHLYPGSKTQQWFALNTRSEHLEYLFKGEKFQDGNAGDHKTLSPKRLNFSNTYFHIPINQESRKYLTFPYQGQIFQFKALPFSLSTTLIEFTVVVKEVKSRAQSRMIRIHQYLNNWLIMSTPLGVDILFLLCPASITLGFRSFQGKVCILSSSNLIWVFIGLIACMGLFVVKIALWRLAFARVDVVFMMRF